MLHATGQLSPAQVCAPRRVRLADGADYAGVCVKTLRRWGDQGRLTLYRTGPRLIFVDLDELDNIASPIPTSEPRR